MKPRTKSSDENVGVVGFRLEADAMRVLAARAVALGVSKHEIARQFVIEMLHEADSRAALHQAVQILHREIRELREDVSLSTQTLLVSAGKVDSGQAEAWVAEQFPLK